VKSETQRARTRIRGPDSGDTFFNSLAGEPVRSRGYPYSGHSGPPEFSRPAAKSGKRGHS